MKQKYIIIALIAFVLLMLNGCKENFNEPINAELTTSEGLSDIRLEKTESYRIVHHELSLLKKATARYHDIQNAIKDGYQDINVILPNMGYHFLNNALLDDKFELEKPELLVYTRIANGKFKLAAVEYAVPLELASQAPEGFTGNLDEWHRNETFQLWTLHAWIWKKNPDGIFAATNPIVP